MIHLDTSFLIRGLVPGSDEDAQLRRWIRSAQPLGMSSVAWAEFLCGPVRVDHVELAARILVDRPPFTERDGALAAQLFNAAGRRRGSLSDCMVAAVSIQAAAPLATSNVRDFERFATRGLKLVGVAKSQG